MDLIGMVTSYLPDKDMLQLIDIFPFFVIRFEHSICYYMLCVVICYTDCKIYEDWVKVTEKWYQKSNLI